MLVPFGWVAVQSKRRGKANQLQNSGFAVYFKFTFTPKLCLEMNERLGSIFWYVLNILSKPWWRKPTPLREWLTSRVSIYRRYTRLRAASLCLQHSVSLRAMGYSYLWFVSSRMLLDHTKSAEVAEFNLFLDPCLLSATRGLQWPCLSLLFGLWIFCINSRSTWRRKRPSCSQSHSIAFWFYYISTLPGQMLGRIEPAPCILMCFFSDHSSFAEDMPLTTGAPRNSTG